MLARVATILCNPREGMNANTFFAICSETFI
jgi:hypothetical protein